MTLSLTVSCSAARVWRPKYSAAAMTAEKTINATAINHRLRAPVRISSLKSRPNTPIGIVPMMTYQPIR